MQSADTTAMVLPVLRRGVELVVSRDLWSIVGCFSSTLVVSTDAEADVEVAIVLDFVLLGAEDRIG